MAQSAGPGIDRDPGPDNFTFLPGFSQKCLLESFNNNNDNINNKPSNQIYDQNYVHCQ